MAHSGEETPEERQQMMLSCRIPGYMGNVPHYERAIGNNVGYTTQLADSALQTDQDYLEAAKRRYSNGQQMSSYMAQIGTATTTSDYNRSPARKSSSKLPASTDQSTEASLMKHWQTTYNQAFNGQAWNVNAPVRCHDPSQITTSSHGPTIHRSSVRSCYGNEFRDPVVVAQNREPGKLPMTKDDLTFGTNKYSNRMLGYSGFVPASANNQHQIHPIMKSTKNELLTMNYRQKCIGYTGHVPHDVSNHRTNNKDPKH